MKVWPAPGRRVRDPVSGRPLTRKGADVPDTAYWRRRLADGDVLDFPPPPAAKPPKPTRRPTPAATTESPA